jgi:hypothetical protein
MFRNEHFWEEIWVCKTHNLRQRYLCKNETEHAFLGRESFAFWEEPGLHSIDAMTNFLFDCHIHRARLHDRQERQCTDKHGNHHAFDRP